MVLRASWLVAALGLVCLTAQAELPPLYQLEIIASHPHDPAAFTQGLLVDDGALVESTGLKGRSTLRRVDPVSGEVRQLRKLDDRLFGEGLALVGDRLVMLTYKAGRGLLFDRHSFEPKGEFSYPGEGWGLAYDGEKLYMSDSGPSLRLLDPDSYEQTGTLEVTLDGQPLPHINELEFVAGELWANVWPSDWIVSIDPQTGKITRRIDASALRRALPAGHAVDVLNGIAYEAASERIYVTGKLWPRLFEVRLTGPLPAP